jgi:hypothetical protein
VPITVDKNGSPIKVTGTTDTDSEILSDTDKAYIKSVYWFKPTTAGDLLTLTDGEGKNIIEMRAEANNGSQQWDIELQFYGIRTPDMDSGTLYIYVR